MNDMVTVYVEYVFFDNAIMNYIILLLVGKILKCNSKRWRRILSACAGAVYATASLVCPFLNILVFKMLLLPAITYCAFGFISLKRFIQNVAGVFGITLAMGGAMMGLFYFTGLGGYLQGVPLLAFPLRIAVSGGLLMVFLINCIKKWNAGRGSFETEFCVAFQSEEHMAALVDTANTLKDPISGLPVVLIHETVARRLLDDEIVDAILKKEVPAGWEERIRIIPFHAMESSGMLLALKPGYASVYFEGWKKVDVFVGIHNGGLKNLGCKALLPACMIH